MNQIAKGKSTEPEQTDSETQAPEPKDNRLFSSPTSDYITRHSLFLSVIDEANYR